MKRILLSFAVCFFVIPGVATILNVKDYQKRVSAEGFTHVLVFLSHQCPCSQSHRLHLNDIAKNFPQIPIYGVISEPIRDEDAVLTYFNDKDFYFPLIRDDQQILVNKYAALKTPHASLIKKLDDSEQILYEGGVTDKAQFSPQATQYLAENLKQLSQGQPLAHRFGRSLGCYIKRSAR